MSKFCCNRILFTALLLLSLIYIPVSKASLSQATFEKGKPQAIIIGIYVTDIFGADISRKTIDVAFWLWMVYKDKTLNPLEHIDIVNAASIKRLSYEVEQLSNGEYWASGKYHATLHQNWDFTSYPLDRQNIEFVFEDTRYSSDKLIYVIDNAQSNVDLQVRLDGWEILNSYWQQKGYLYKSNFGATDENHQNSTVYSRATFKVELKREGIRKLIQVFGVAYLACFLAFCIYFLPLNELRGRLGLATGAIFALVGSKLLTDNYLPATMSLTLVDEVQMVSMVFLGFTILMTMLIYYFNQHQKIRLSRWLNGICFSLALVSIPAIQIFLLFVHYYR